MNSPVGIPANAGDIRPKSLQVKKPIKAGIPYQVTMPYTRTDKAKVTSACFLWSGEGPYCFNALTGKKSIEVTLRTNNPNKYKLQGFVVYTSGGKSHKSNRVSAKINVKK